MSRNKTISIKKLTAICMLMILWVTSFGGSLFEHNDPKLNLSTDHVYEVCDPGRILTGLKTDRASVYPVYNGAYVCVNVTVDRIESKKMTVTGGGYTGIIVRTSAPISSSVHVGDTCSVFGCLELGTVNLSMTIREAGLSFTLINEDADYYTFIDGRPRAFYDDRTDLHELKGGRITYRTPLSWRAVRCNDEGKAEIFNSGLTENADCYFLNELTGRESPECFIIFYFDIDKYVSFDNKKNQYSEIEAEIVNNICPEDNGGMLKSFYLAMDKLGSESEAGTVNYMSIYGPCRVEFIFRETDGGIVVMMYVTESEYSYREEALYIQRTLSVS